MTVFLYKGILYFFDVTLYFVPTALLGRGVLLFQMSNHDAIRFVNLRIWALGPKQEPWFCYGLVAMYCVQKRLLHLFALYIVGTMYAVSINLRLRGPETSLFKLPSIIKPQKMLQH